MPSFIDVFLEITDEFLNGRFVFRISILYLKTNDIYYIFEIKKL